MKPDEIISGLLLDITDPVEFGAEEYWCAMKVLDQMYVPREDGDETLSLVGRIKHMQRVLVEYARPENKREDRKE